MKVTATKIHYDNWSLKINFFILLFLCTFIGFASLGHTQDNFNKASPQSLILSDNYAEHYLSPYLTKYRDSAKNMTIKDVISGLFLTGELSTQSGSIVPLHTDGDDVWLSFDVVNRSSTTRWQIDFGTSFMGRFGLFDSVETYLYDFTTNELQRKTIVDDGQIILNVGKNSKSKIILHLTYKKGLPTAIPLRILHYETAAATNHFLPLSIFTSFLVGMIFFFGAIAFIRSHHHYLYFSLYYALLCGTLITQNISTISTVPLIGSALIPFLFLLTSIAGFMTTRLFWNIDQHTAIFQKLFVGFIGLSVAIFFSGVLFPLQSEVIKYSLYYGPSLLILIAIPLISLLVAQDKGQEIFAYMLGWLILLFGICITILSLSEIIPDVSSAINALWYTLIPQAFFFVIASKIKYETDFQNVKMSRTLEIEETETVTKLRENKENTEQARLLKVIEQERKVLGELRKSEARRTEEMRTAKEEADEANKAKSAFLAVVSHEIRTPMTGIMGMVRLLLDSNLTKEQKEYAMTVQDSSDAMLALLNDILDFEKIEQGKMAFENINFDLHRLINGVTTLMKGHASQKNIELRTKIGKTLPQYVYGDPSRLRQVLLNLTGNAIKFTTEGHVTLTVELMHQKDSSDECEIYFGITDTGVGVSKAAQKDLFSPFSQADSSISRKFGGTGLGLAISKGLVQGMGSTININSNEGEGSTFFFTLTMFKGSSESSGERYIPKETNHKTKPLKILVVDDNKINQKVVEGFLQKTPHILTMINSAQIAINRLEKETFDLILMDIEMPDLNGDIATQHIRASDNEDIKNIPILALTGNAMPQDIEKYYKAGMNGVIEKPIDIDLLKSTINKAGQNIFDNPLQNIAPPTQSPKKQKPVFEGSEIKVIQKTPLSTDTHPESTAQPEPKKEEGKTLHTETLDTLKTHLKTKDIKEMLDDVIKKNDEIIVAMNAALKDGKNADLAARAHEMKGMAGNFGLIALSEQAGKIESKAKLGEPSLTLTALLAPMPEMQKRAQKALNQWLEDNQD